MPQPVVHFEVIGKNPDRLRQYYGDLFGWTFDTPSPVAKEISDADSYGFLELVTADDGTGIRGGIGGGESYDSHAVFYVGVENVEAALLRAEHLGGTRVNGPCNFAKRTRRRPLQGSRRHADWRCRNQLSRCGRARGLVNTCRRLGAPSRRSARWLDRAPATKRRLGSGRRRAHPGASHTTGRAGPHPAVRVASRKRRYGSANPFRPRLAQYALGRARARTGEFEMRQ